MKAFRAGRRSDGQRILNMNNINDSGEWPDVAVCIPTFNRAGIVIDTVDYLFSNLLYRGKVHFFVGCDGSDNTPDALKNAIAPEACTVLREPAASLGANLNRLVKLALEQGYDYIITQDDDHQLIAPLHLERHIAKLRSDANAGRIHLLMEGRGDEHFDTYDFYAELDRDHYWRVSWTSRSRYIVSLRPNLTHRRWWEVMGYLPEGVRVGETELRYGEACAMRGRDAAGVNVLVPLLAHGAQHWHHNNAGTSWNRMGL